MKSDPVIYYSQPTGEFFMLNAGGAKTSLGFGWAGYGVGKNNPAMQDVPNVGPLPRGRYAIGAPFTHEDCGPFSMRLTPLPGTDTLGRSGFLIHGPGSGAKYGQESHGCTILERSKRVALWNTGARILEVI